MGTTNVPSPTWTVLGFQAPLESQILTGVQEDLNAAFGGNLNFTTNDGSPTNSTPQGQLAASMAAIIGNVNDTFLFYTQQVDPQYAEGRMQDGIGRIYFIERNGAQPTVLQIGCNGGNNVTIPVGALITDGTNFYMATVSGTIPSSGSITLSFACTVPGPVAVPETVTIAQTLPGWDSANVIGGTVGTNTENRSDFEARRALSVAKNAVNTVSAVRGAVLAVPGVLDAFVTENPNSNSLTIGTGAAAFTLAPNSLYVAVVGGLASDVAQAIWSKKPPGCSYNGNTTVEVFDQNSGYVEPFPAYDVTFEIPATLDICMTIVIASNPGVPSDADSQIQTALVNAFAGLDGGPRYGIGSTILASRFIAPVVALGSWAQVISLQIGSENVQSASFVGSISGNTLTVTSMASGTLAIGQFIFDNSDLVADGTIITALGTGSGGTGTYTLSNSQTVSSENMIAVSANQNTVQVGIGQTPSITAPLVNVSTGITGNNPV